jgi:hypothetical protein
MARCLWTAQCDVHQRVRELDENRGTHATRSRSAGTPITRAFAPEKITHSREQIGNFPQVFSHLSLMDAAKSLNEAVNADRNEGQFC